MKSKIFISVLFASVLIVSLSSCSRCYKCSSYVYYDNNGVTDSTQTTEDICTASQAEIDNKENEGQTCIAG